MSIAYLNGAFAPLDECRVSPLDRGFIFGDGVYEVVPVYGGRLFQLPEHLQRLHNSLEAVRIAPPHDARAWTSLLEELVVRNGGGDQSVYLQISRGAAPRNHAFPKNVVPTVFAMSNPLAAKSTIAGVKVVTREDYRWQRGHIKSTALLAAVLLRQEAAEAGAAEALLLRDGMLTEGAATNVFVVRAGAVSTPPKSNLLLPGITRDLVVELCREAGLACLEEPVTEAAFRAADEIWITSSTLEVAPVLDVDGRAIGNGSPGPVARAVWAKFQDYKRRHQELAA